MSAEPSPGRSWRPRASVVIPTWNGAAYLPACLDSLRSQSLGPPGSAFELLVVDNGSRDATDRVLAGYPELRVLRLPRNLGFAGAVNVGIRAARSDLIVLLNNDTEVDPGWLEALVRALEAAPEAGMASSKVLLAGQRDHLHTTGDTMTRAGMAGNRGVWERDRGQYDEAREVFGANAAAAAYRRALFDDVGDFEEAFGSYMEDVDLAWRARLAGWACIFVPEARVYHHVSATGGGPYASYHVARNRIWLLARNYPTRLLLRNLPAILAAQLQLSVDALRAWRGGAARATLRGQLVGLLSWPRMLPSRRRIQASRRIDDAELDALLQ